MDQEANFTTVSIPTPLFKKLEERIKGTSFSSVSDYIVYILQETMFEEGEGEVTSKEDEEKVKERLRALGYID
jgi:Arc/MetJ-type ribon-helix-helix transcriptional regulator